MAVAEAIASQGPQAAAGESAALALVDEEGQLVRVLYDPHEGKEHQGPGRALRWRTFDLESRVPLCEAIRGGLPVLLGSMEEVARRYPQFVDEVQAAGLSARASVPLHSVGGSVLGAVEFGWPAPQTFDASHLRRLELIAVLAGLALERAMPGAPWSPGQAPRGLETMPSPFFSVDRAMRITYVNAEGQRALRAPVGNLVGRRLFDVFAPVVGSDFELQCRHSLDTGLPVTFEEYYPTSGSWYEVQAWPDQGGLNVSFWNIDERRTGERQRSAALREAEQARAGLKFLSELSSRLRGVTTRAEVFERLTSAVVPALCDWSTLVVPGDGELVRVAAAHRQPELDALAKRLVGAYPHSFSGPSPGVPVYRTGQPIRLARLAQQIVADLDDSAASTGYGRSLVLLGDGPGLIMPVHSGGEVVAVLTMVRAGGELFSDPDVDLMYEVAECVATALEDANHVESERATASALQDAVLPKSLPQPANLDLAAGYRAAAEGSQVGGDWYDAFELPNGYLALTVGDAAGHGLQAAAVMAQMRNALRAYLFASLGPAEALASLRRLLAIQEPDAFATAICAEVDPSTGNTKWASAGHPAPVLVRAGRSTYLGGEPAPPIGWAEDTVIAAGLEYEFTLVPGDRLVMFTDGLVERRGVNLEIGLTHLMILAEQMTHSSARAACDAIFHDMSFASHEDDVCVLIADFKPSTTAPMSVRN
jgi:serine phosphatase RsbU (regulator of sigma subunit)/PAS domain-containing protein